MSEERKYLVEDKIRLINQYEAIVEDAKEKAEAIKDEIKAMMTEECLDSLVTDNFVVRWTDVVSSRFDTKRFKEDFGAESYAAYCKQIVSKKFTISK